MNPLKAESEANSVRNKLRLLLLGTCERGCKGCCNNDLNFGEIPFVQRYEGYDLIMLTGGEPMNHPNLTRGAIEEIREQTGAPIYLYTAKTSDPELLVEILDSIEGITITLHSNDDIADFEAFDRQYRGNGEKAYRLNVFAEVSAPYIASARWKIKDNIHWIPDCPLPAGEQMGRFRNCGQWG